MSLLRRLVCSWALAWTTAGMAQAAAVPFVLPPGEPVAEWAGALSMAGFVAGSTGSGPGAEVRAVGGAWELRVRDDHGSIHVVTVPRPASAAAREDLVWLAASLAHPGGAKSDPVAALLVATPPRMAPAPVPVERVAARPPAPVAAGAPPPPPVQAPPPPSSAAADAAPAVADAAPAAADAAPAVADAAPAVADAAPAAADAAPAAAPAAPLVRPLSGGGLTVSPVDTPVASLERPRFHVEAGLSAGPGVRGGLPPFAEAAVRVDLVDARGLRGLLVVAGPGGAAPTALGEGHFWEGSVGAGVGWEGHRTWSPGLSLCAGAGFPSLSLPTTADTVHPTPRLWATPRVRWSPRRSWGVVAEVPVGVDLTTVRFTAAGLDLGSISPWWARFGLGLTLGGG